jgi:hypothetical protein
VARDPHGDDLVRGLTLDDLRKKFRRVYPSDNLPEGHYGMQYQQYYKSSRHVWLGNSGLMVEFKGERAARITFIKG